jgi:anthranilate synthase component 2
MLSQVLLIDNYDSFVFNLSRYLEELDVSTTVVRNDAITIAEIRALAPSAIVLSPGPCTPEESGISVEVVREFYQSIPILGVCLGHQAIAAAFGGKIVNAAEPVHGRASVIHHDTLNLFDDCDSPMTVARYHSLIVEEDSLPAELQITSRTEDRVLMSFQHRCHPVYGVQFHPESILTHSGHRILTNFLKLAGIPVDTKIPQGDMLSVAASTNDFYLRQIAPNASRPL